jgi:myo-inositol catabolism protein IolS
MPDGRDPQGRTLNIKRRTLLTAAAAAGGLAVAAAWRKGRDVYPHDQGDYFVADTARAGTAVGMPMRDFGRTGLKVSEVGFGTWGIGGKGYGHVQEAAALSALARAEELGCNLIDSALVYGDSERLLGQFLQGRRSKWIVATKYSGQPAGMTATLEEQLRLLRTDAVDLYQIHWVPRGEDERLFDELNGLKRAGKARFIGVSLYSAEDIDFVLARPELDSFQVAFNLLEPDPFMARVPELRNCGKGIIVRSVLREGFLTGKYKRDATFPDPDDQRHKWTPEQIALTVDRVERFRFLEQEAGSMVAAAARYPLSFAAVSTVIMGTKSLSQADSNFGRVPGGRLSPESLARVRAVQLELGLGSAWRRLLRRVSLAP